MLCLLKQTKCGVIEKRLQRVRATVYVKEFPFEVLQGAWPKPQRKRNGMSGSEPPTNVIVLLFRYGL